MASWAYGLAEELALERLLASEYEREADEAWKARQYTWARLCRARAVECRAHIAELERAQQH